MPIKEVILAGGLGTSLAEETSLRPKPMAQIGAGNREALALGHGQMQGITTAQR